MESSTPDDLIRSGDARVAVLYAIGPLREATPEHHLCQSTRNEIGLALLVCPWKGISQDGACVDSGWIVKNRCCC